MNLMTRLALTMEHLDRLDAMASQIQSESRLVTAEIGQIKAMLFGDVPAVPTPAPVPAEPAPELASVQAPPAAAAAAAKMPNTDLIRSEAAKYGVDIESVLPRGRKPTLQQKGDAMRMILKAKKAKEAGDEVAAATPEEVATPAAPADEDDVDISSLVN